MKKTEEDVKAPEWHPFYTDRQIVDKTVECLTHKIEQLRRDEIGIKGQIEALETMLSNIQVWKAS